MKNKDMRKNNEIKTVVPALRFPEFRGMNEWEENKLNSLCDIINGKCNAQDHVEGGLRIMLKEVNILYLIVLQQ